MCTESLTLFTQPPTLYAQSRMIAILRMMSYALLSVASSHLQDSNICTVYGSVELRMLLGNQTELRTVRLVCSSSSLLQRPSRFYVTA